LGDLEPVRDSQMPAERLRAKPALKANHIILLRRAADRHRWPRRPCLYRRGHPETAQCPIYRDNQCSKLVGRNLVMPHITANDVCNLIEIDT
jgi:hypothetical protein